MGQNNFESNAVSTLPVNTLNIMQIVASAVELESYLSLAEGTALCAHMGIKIWAPRVDQKWWEIKVVLTLASIKK